MAIEELKKMSISDLRGKVEDLKRKLAVARCKASLSNLSDTSTFKKLKKEIARLLTVLSEKSK